MLQGKRFGSNEKVVAETDAYFESKNESFYKKDIENLEKRWNECITLEENFFDKFFEFLEKTVFFLVGLETY